MKKFLKMADVDELKAKRKVAKSRITRMKTFLDSLNDDNPSNVDTLQLKKSVYIEGKEAFYTAQSQIVQLTEDDATQDAEIDAIAEMDDKLLEIDLLLMNALRRLGVDDKNDNQSEYREADSSVHSIHSRQENKRKLPKLPDLKLPEFTGKFDEWIDFKIKFTSIIRDDTSIVDSHKLLYLRGCLKGDASNLQADEETFTSLWEALVECYENSRYIIDKHIGEFINEKAMGKGSSKDLRRIINNAKKHMRAFAALDYEPDKLSEAILINILLKKLDAVVRHDFEMSLKPNVMPTWKETMEFLQKRANTLESLDLKRDGGYVETKSNSRTSGKSKVFNNSNSVKNSAKDSSNEKKNDKDNFKSSLSCFYCKKSHFLTDCVEFMNLKSSDRVQKIVELGLCLNCLKRGHSKEECKRSRCPYCQEAHHSRLHPEPVASTSKGQPNFCVVSNRQILLNTALIYVYDSNGNKHLCRCLIDSGGMSSLMSEHLFQTLKLKKSKINLSVSGVNDNTTKISSKTSAVIGSRVTEFKRKIEFLVIPKITGEIPCCSFDLKNLKLPENMKLADEKLNIPGKIDLLLGIGEHKGIFLGDKFELGENLPTAELTEFGYVLGGRLSVNETVNCSFRTIVSNEELNDGLKKFWELESVPKQKQLSYNERLAEQHFKETVYRLCDGRFGVRMPFNSKLSQLGNSKLSALKRYLKLEQRFEKNSELKIEYDKFMREYSSLGHMSLSKEALNDQEEGFYFAHHAVFKKSGDTSKIRVVFDGSCPTSSGLSLNDVLLNGVVAQENLQNILIGTRFDRYVLFCDIVKMYRQVLMHPEDRKYQKIFYRFSKSDPVGIWLLNTVTYGASDAPSQATQAVNLLAEIYSSKFPLAAKVLQKRRWMDDCLGGADTLNETLKLRNELIELLKLGGFELHKWCSNSPELLEEIPIELQENEKAIDEDSEVKTLGISWLPKSDTFKFRVNMKMDNTKKITKRYIASQVHSYFDPIGLTGPVSVYPKLFLQKLWMKGYDWDAELDSEDRKFWEEYCEQLKFVNELSVDRYVLMDGKLSITQIHGFADASTIGYGACIYVRCVDSFGNVRVSLLSSKSKVAPLTAQTIAKLELCAAELLVELWHSIKDTIEIDIEKTIFWSDSKIVLSWIRIISRQLNVFVAHRVAKIQELTGLEDEWRHVPTQDNPADLLSRGLMPEKLQSCELWWNGPSFLMENEESWPDDKRRIPQEELPEVKTQIYGVVETYGTSSVFSWTNDFRKLIRQAAYWMRFINFLRRRRIGMKLRKDKIDGWELFCARNRLIERCQMDAFPKERDRLLKEQELDKNSRLIQLSPFLDKFGIMRLGGRLRNSDESFYRKHPVILPPNHPLTTAIIRQYHVENLHAGTQIVLNSIRSRFWVLQGRSQVRKVLINCVECFRKKPKRMVQQMGQLPEVRIKASAPFMHSGVDYAGPITLKVSRNVSKKSYIAVFTCMATRSVHLELAGDLSSESFMNALYRFIGRRGVCKTMHSDNGTNFVGAVRKLKELKELLNDELHRKKIEKFCESKEIEWKFIPPGAPHMGGTWESMVKSVKTLLVHFLGKELLYFEEMSTILVQIEAVLNSRPLTVLTEDPNDLTALTPGHFLIGRPLTELAEPDLTDLNINRLTRFQYLSRLKQEFWQRWSKDYLNQLQMRFKWHYKVDVRLGQVVVIVEDNVPATQWPMGRITKLHPGKDNIVRVVTIQTKNGELKRPLTKVCFLPIDSEN